MGKDSCFTAAEQLYAVSKWPVSGLGKKMAKKPVKVGVQRGGGPPPGYRWTVRILDSAYDEAMSFLNQDQYQHIASQIKALAREQDPTHSVSQSIDAIEDFHELRDKGGILGGVNVRVFFFLNRSQSELIVLGAIKKQNDGPTPRGDKFRMARRKRKYLHGEFEAM
jgi:hypothetical protein